MNRTNRYFGVLLFFLVFLAASLLAPARADEGGGQKAVLVTGASTGIGRKMTEVLAAEGFFVYAGARKQADIDALNALDNVQAVKLDVTLQDEIDAAVATIEGAGRGLFGLINNAGVYIGGPMIDVPIEELEWMMDVNVTGVVRVTQAFAPMIIASKGRISTTGSIAGLGTRAFSGQYSMSKHAIEAFTDALAAEMTPLGVSVSVIEPGSYDSEIGRSAVARMRAKADEYTRTGSPFAEQFKAMLGQQDGDRSMYKPPDEVADAALHAMSSPTPMRRYLVVPDEQAAERVIGNYVDELKQLNQWQAYSYSDEELIAMIAATPPAETAQAELTALLHYFLANSGQEEAHAKFWADELVYTSSNGTRFGKDDIMAGFASAADDDAASDTDDAGPSVMYTGEDIKIQVFGTTAVVTFRLVGTPDDGSAVSEYFNSGTFVNRQGAWHAVAWQATIIPGET